MSKPEPKANVEVFNRDAASNEGYIYTKSPRLSCRLATARSAEAILATGRLAGRSILDAGCGDGSYTIRFWDKARPKSMIGVDPADQAIAVANAAREGRPIEFVVGNAHELPYPENSFDLVMIQSILHHDDQPRETIREAFRLAPEILIHEPNGNNAGVKIIEKLSAYHREHDEKSYSSFQLKRWITEAGGEVTYERFAGFVPMFSPDWLAKCMKAAEPFIEGCPLLKQVGCAVVVLVARRRAGIGTRLA